MALTKLFTPRRKFVCRLNAIIGLEVCLKASTVQVGTDRGGRV